MQQFRKTRIAPTPSGYLHVGNGVSFALTYLLAQRAGADILLRIDDLDRGRFRENYLKDIFETLHWMGISWQEGPTSARQFEPWAQYQRLDRYFEFLENLRATGMVYACDCSRKQVRADSQNGRYAGTCRNKGLSLENADYAWRIRVPEGTVVNFLDSKGASETVELATKLGDFVVRKRFGKPSYQVSSTVDDLYFGIDFIVRGADLRESTAAQTYLAQVVGAERFGQIRFLHHPLLTDESGDKLSKSEGAPALKTWRAAGKDPAELFAIAKRWLVG